MFGDDLLRHRPVGCLTDRGYRIDGFGFTLFLISLGSAVLSFRQAFRSRTLSSHWRDIEFPGTDYSTELDVFTVLSGTFAAAFGFRFLFLILFLFLKFFACRQGVILGSSGCQDLVDGSLSLVAGLFEPLFA